MLKIGLIGCGFMGDMHANCYKNIKGVNLTAVADLCREKAEKAASGTEAVIYGDGKELIANADVDVIDICLPTFLHTEYAIAAMEKVKYLFIEKPVALTSEEGDSLIKKANETGCNIQIGQVIRFWDEYTVLRDIVKSGKYGKVVNANFRRISPRPDWGWESWLTDARRSGGAAQDLHIHDTDYVLSVFGQPKNFYSVKNTVGETNSYINTLMQYEDFVVTVEGTWDLPFTHPFEASFRVVFEKATVENGANGFMLYTDSSAEKIEIEKKELIGNVSGGNISDLGGYYNELAYFCDRAENNLPIDRATLEEGVASLKFVKKELSFNA
ncbi:MAG: Gfo/Idh/MocA family oxidoreductase [Ruminococcaceae bacterium]|nr:Gfo/Idh/MocA family oxidoreductase [Oscillospiraceae bacterium]